MYTNKDMIHQSDGSTDELFDDELFDDGSAVLKQIIYKLLTIDILY